MRVPIRVLLRFRVKGVGSSILWGLRRFKRSFFRYSVDSVCLLEVYNSVKLAQRASFNEAIVVLVAATLIVLKSLLALGCVNLRNPRPNSASCSDSQRAAGQRIESAET